MSNAKPVDAKPVVHAEPVDSEQVPNNAISAIVSYSIVTESNISVVAKQKVTSPGSESSSPR